MDAKLLLAWGVGIAVILWVPGLAAAEDAGAQRILVLRTEAYGIAAATAAEVGQEIPEELYSAVAAVLGYVFRMRGVALGA